MATTEQPSRIQPLLTALMTASWLALASMSGACATADEAVDTDDDGGQGQGQNPTTTGTGGAPGTGGGPNLGTGGDPTTTGSTTTTGTGSTTTTGTGGQGGQPSTSTNDCCADNPTPGCQDPMVESCVCAIDNYCCSSAWDSVCVGIAENDCGHGCGGQGAGGQGGTGGQGGAGGNPPSQGCEQCILQQCGLQCILDGTCSQSIDLLVFDCLVFTCGQACWGWSPPAGAGPGRAGRAAAARDRAAVAVPRPRARAAPIRPRRAARPIRASKRVSALRTPIAATPRGTASVSTRSPNSTAGRARHEPHPPSTMTTESSGPPVYMHSSQPPSPGGRPASSLDPSRPPSDDGRDPRRRSRVRTESPDHRCEPRDQQRPVHVIGVIALRRDRRGRG